MPKKLKSIFLFLSFLFITDFSFSENFKIVSVEYQLQKTKSSALERKYPISKKVFNSFIDFHNYMEDFQKQLRNERIFNDALVTYRYSYEFDENKCTNLIHVTIYAIDSKNLLILPYPKYSSSSGFEMKLKIKDSNFLGTMNDFSSDIFFALKNDEDDTSVKNKSIGINLKYDFPFNIKNIKSSWNNDFEIEYTFEKDSIEYNISSGFSFEFPLENNSFVFSITQRAIRNLEYEIYNDENYFNTDFNISLPITVSEILNWGKVIWEPFVDYSINYKKEGFNIDFENTDLTSPVLTFGHKVESKRINWIGNFRNGLSATFGQSIGYDFQRNEYKPKVYGDILAFKSFKYMGINTHLYTFASFNTNELIDEKLRGIIDEQKYKNSISKALKTSSAIILNMDFPIHVISVNWNDWTEYIFGKDSWITEHTKWWKYFDFELQLSPFLDLALTNNKITEKTFDAKDGWYSGGFELLIFPKKWRSIVVRASYGTDLGKTFINRINDEYYNESWRSNVSTTEVYIGIGLHY